MISSPFNPPEFPSRYTNMANQLFAGCRTGDPGKSHFYFSITSFYFDLAPCQARIYMLITYFLPSSRDRLSHSTLRVFDHSAQPFVRLRDARVRRTRSQTDYLSLRRLSNFFLYFFFTQSNNEHMRLCASKVYSLIQFRKDIQKY